MKNRSPAASKTIAVRVAIVIGLSGIIGATIGIANAAGADRINWSDLLLAVVGLWLWVAIFGWAVSLEWKKHKRHQSDSADRA